MKVNEMNNQMTLQQLIDEVRARLEAATLAPWKMHTVESVENWFEIIGSNCDSVCSSATWSNPDGALADSCRKDFELIAHAPSDLARLLRIVEVQREALEHYECSHYCLEGLACRHDQTASDALAAAEQIAKGEA